MFHFSFTFAYYFTFIFHYCLAIDENDLPNDTIEHLTFVQAPSDASPTNLTPPTSHQYKSITDALNETSPTTEFIRSNSKSASLSTEPPIERKTSTSNDSVTTNDEIKSNISSSIGPATSGVSPSSTRHFKPLSLTSTQAYFKTIQRQERSSSPNIQHVQTIIHDDDKNDDDDEHQKRTSSMKHGGERKEIITSVRFMGNDENGRKLEETYL
jgi:hypothetical protein